MSSTIDIVMQKFQMLSAEDKELMAARWLEELELGVVPEWHKQVLAERLRDMDENPNDQVPWSVVKERLKARRSQ